MQEQRYMYTCEVCGRVDVLTPKQAKLLGWDYPPFVGFYRVISPRTCPECSIFQTVWADISLRNKSPDDLTTDQIAVIERIIGEPENMIVNNPIKIVIPQKRNSNENNK